MQKPASTSSREELLRLREEGRITEAEYRNLLAALQNPASTGPPPDRNAEPQFRAFRLRILTGALVICAIGLPVGIALRLPYVWILSIVGLVVGTVKLKRIEGSWLADILARRKRG